MKKFMRIGLCILTGGVSEIAFIGMAITNMAKNVTSEFSRVCKNYDDVIDAE